MKFPRRKFLRRQGVLRRADAAAGDAGKSETNEVLMEKGFAERFAKEWVAAWNSHDLERILSHYEDDFEMLSPIITALVGEPSEGFGAKRQSAHIGPRRFNSYHRLISCCSLRWLA